MGDLDAETIDWLNTLRLGNKLNYLSDFQNGYYMGQIFERMNLAKGRKFKNTNDMACKFQNFKNIRDLLYENFRVDFPIQNILFNTESLLLTIRDSINKYNRQKKQATLRRIQTFSVGSKIQPSEQKLFSSRRNDILSSSKMNQTTKFPKKIQQIEQKLEKYKEIKTKHQIMALEDRRRQIQENRRVIQQHRLYQINKVRTNHEFMKEHERKVFDVWMKTEQIKQNRIEKDNNLKSFLQEKKNKFAQSLRDEQVNSFKQGLQAFQMNCIRQGIQLEHDPDKPAAKTEQNYNKQVVMERIKDNIKIHQKERKDRIKRQNKKRVDAKQANDKAEVIWAENNLVEDYAKKIHEHLDFCTGVKKTMNREAAQKQIIKRKAKNKSYAELPKPLMTEQERNQQYRIRQMQYRQHQIQRLQRRDKKHRLIAQNALEALINIVITNEDKYYNNKGFTYSEWKNIQKEYLKFEKKQRRTKASSRYIDQSYQGNAKQYIQQVGQWNLKQKQKPEFELSKVLSEVIQKAYPAKQVPQKGDVPLHMPLKIGFIGNRLSGKSSLASKISAKYGVPIIDPKNLLKQAIELNKQPVVEDPKKKKDSKKPEEENPQKIALKQFGQKMMKKISEPQQATIDDYIEVIQFALRRNNQNRDEQGILQEFKQEKEKQTQRYNKALKDFEDAQKKGKKDPKKPEGDEPPSQRKYFYTKGFILEGLDLSQENLKKLQLKLNNYICFEERINDKGQQLKQTISTIVPVPKAVKDNKLQKGTFDLLIELDASPQKLEQRQSAQKIEILSNDYSGIKRFYSDFGNEKTKLKAYYAIQNNGSLDECVDQVSKLIEAHLDQKYEQIQAYQKEQKPQDPVEQPKVEEKDLKVQDENKEVPKQNEQSKGEPQKQINNQEIVQKKKSVQLSKQTSIKLINKFDGVFKKYMRNLIQAFTDYDQLRNEFGVHLMAIQQQFISIINRPDDKASKVLTFQQNYNKLLSQKTSIVKDNEASKHLISKLDELNDNLWSMIEIKKNQAVTERQKIVASNILNNEIENIIQITKAIFQNELNLLVEIIFFIYNYNNSLNGRNEDIPTEYLVLGIPPNIEPIISFQNDEFKSPRMEYYLNQTQQCIKGLPGWLKKKEKKFKIEKSAEVEAILVDFIQKQVSKINERLGQIKIKAKQLYLEYYCFFRVLTNKMDDWIIQGIKHENQFVYDIYKNIKKSILDAKRSGVKDLFVKDITDIIHPISTLPHKRLPIVEQTQVNHFKILSFATFMQQIKCLATSGKISFKVFKSYFQKRRKSKWLCPEFLQLEFDIMQQYLVTDDYCNYREVALAMLLWNIKILDEDSINEYQKNLAGSTEQKNQNENYQYLKEEIQFEEFNIMPGITKDPEQERIMNTFIFQIFREDHRDKIVVKDYIDTLKLFSQLQVYRYGDTLMILHQAGDKHYDNTS